MPDINPFAEQNPDLPPPSGDPKQAEKYISQLIQLIDTDRLDVLHTDLGRFDPSSLQDHYRVELKGYRVEISHSKHPNSGKDSYIILFTNIKHLTDGNSEKIILAYMHLDTNQFSRFKKSSSGQIDRKRKAEEEKRLIAALEPVDQVLENFDSSQSTSYPAIS